LFEALSFVRPALQAFFRPDRRFPMPTRAEAVKAGRRSGIAAHFAVSRPRLDSFEHDGMLGSIASPRRLMQLAITSADSYDLCARATS
jgi:hypothetical protein